MRPLHISCGGVLALLLALPSALPAQSTRPPVKPPPLRPQPAPAAAQSTHFPILLIAQGNAPAWSVRIGMKGPQELDRAGYPPIVLTPGDVTPAAAGQSWSYAAVDAGTNAALTVQLTRESCTDAAGAKYPFRALVSHAQIGSLAGCARIAPDEFPEFKQKNLDDDDPEKKKPGPAPITKFKPPFAIAFLDPERRVVMSRGETRKIAARSGGELCVSHDGKRLLYTRQDSAGGPERTIVLYDFAIGTSKDLVRGAVRQASWSPDDSRVAFLKLVESKWQLWIFPVNAPESATAAYAGSLDSLYGWAEPHVLFAASSTSALWIADDGSVRQTVGLKDILGSQFVWSGSDAMRINPVNADLLLVSANYANAPAGAAVDSKGMAAAVFLYEVKSHRRVTLTSPNDFASDAEWSRDGLQVYFTHGAPGKAQATDRIFWDGSGLRRYREGTSLVIGQ